MKKPEEISIESTVSGVVKFLKEYMTKLEDTVIAIEQAYVANHQQAHQSIANSMNTSVEVIGNAEEHISVLSSEQLKKIGMPIPPGSLWQEEVLPLLNLALTELHPNDLPFRFVTICQDNVNCLMIETQKSIIGSREQIRLITEQLITKLHSYQESLLNEAEWQLLPNADGYFHQSLSQEIVFRILSIYLLTNNALNVRSALPKELCVETDKLADGKEKILKVSLFGKDADTILCQRFKFTNLLPVPNNQLRNLMNLYKKNNDLILNGRYSDKELLTKQFKLLEQIFAIVSAKPCARMFYQFYRFSKVGLEIQLLMNKVFESKAITAHEGIQIIRDFDGLRDIIKNIPLGDYSDDQLKFVAQGLAMQATIAPFQLTEAEITQCPSDIARKKMLAAECCNLSMFNEIALNIIEHAKACLSNQNFKRLNIICGSFAMSLIATSNNYLQAFSLENMQRLEGLTAILFKIFDLDVTLPPQSWQLDIIKHIYNSFHIGIPVPIKRDFSQSALSMSLIKVIVKWPGNSTAFTNVVTLLKHDILKCLEKLIKEENTIINLNRMAFAINVLFKDRSIVKSSLVPYCDFLLAATDNGDGNDNFKRNIRENIKAVKAKLTPEQIDKNMNQPKIGK